MEHTTKTMWPDLSKDQRAWELAKVALGSGAPLGAVVARAQTIKEALVRGDYERI